MHAFKGLFLCTLIYFLTDELGVERLQINEQITFGIFGLQKTYHTNIHTHTHKHTLKTKAQIICKLNRVFQRHLPHTYVQNFWEGGQ